MKNRRCLRTDGGVSTRCAHQKALRRAHFAVDEGVPLLALHVQHVYIMRRKELCTKDTCQ